MAIRSKAKPKAGKKPSKSRKPVKKKGDKRKGKAGLTLGIGVISTIAVGTPLRNAFKSGLNNPNVTIKTKFALSYNQAKLKREIEQFNNNSAIGLIITLGGLVAYNVAAAFATKPFLSLVGAAPAPAPAKCLGGVTLQSYLSDPLRVTYLEGKGFSELQIGLFYNPNSVMANDEKARWTGATPPIPGGVDASGENSSAVYPANFAGIPSNITALVVSADPFFQDTKDPLVAAANSSGRYVCYPLQDFGDASPAPTHQKATLYGPALADAYKLLGVLAGNALTTGSGIGFAAPPDTIKDL